MALRYSDKKYSRNDAKKNKEASATEITEGSEKSN
jgi:hypothetical protein